MTAKIGKIPTQKGYTGDSQLHNGLMVWCVVAEWRKGIILPAGKKWKGSWKVWNGSEMKERS